MPRGPLITYQRSNSTILERKQLAPLIPKWLAEKMDNIQLMEAFRVARRLHRGDVDPGVLDLLRNEEAHLDLSDCIFARWLQLRCRGRHEVIYDASKRRRGVARWVCRILMNRNGTLHMIPGINLHVHCLDRPPLEMIIFSQNRDRKRNILYFPHGGPGASPLLCDGFSQIPEECSDAVAVADGSLEGFYPQVVDELWHEMLRALEVLGVMALGGDCRHANDRVEIYS